MTRPRQWIADDCRAANHLPADRRHKAHERTALDFGEPGAEDLLLADVARQKQKIVCGEFPREGKHRWPIGGSHQTDIGGATLVSDGARIFASVIVQTDLS